MESASHPATFPTTAPPIRSLLVATDFSPGADRALAWAVHLAARYEAEVHVLHVSHHEAAVRSPSRLDAGEEASPESVAETPMRRVLQRYREAGVPLHTHIEQGTAVAPRIARAAHAQHADLVVVGTHGRRGVRRLMLGSVAEEVVRTADRPVLVVPPEAHAPEPELGRVLMPIDFSGFSLGALPWARGLSEAFEARLELYHVIESYSLAEVYGLEAILVSGAHPSMKALAHEMAERIQQELTAAHIDAAVHLDEGHAAASITQFARTYGADMIVMASHGRTGFQRFLLGSVTTRVLRTAPCPMLIVRADVGEEEGA